MNDSSVIELTKYISSLNKLNDFDLAWRWVGHDTEPWIEVYEQAEQHSLCVGTVSDIIPVLRENLSEWDLEDLVHYV